MPLVEAVSGVVAVIRLNSTTKDAVRRFQGVVGDAGGLLLGIVATGNSTTRSYGYRSDPATWLQATQHPEVSSRR